MLAADKQLLDARLRDELQQLRVAELGNVVLRFQNILTPSTLIAGFSFTAIVELDFLPTGTEHEMPHRAEPIFYIAAASALSLSLFVTTIASTGIIFGQRLQVQSTAEQGSRHNQLVEELDSKFIQCLAALCTAMICVVVSAIAVVWVKQSYNDGEWHGTSITASIIVGVLFLWTSVTLMQMGLRLHTWRAPTSTLSLRSSRADFRGQPAAAATTGVGVHEFYVGEEGQARADLALAQQPHGTANGRPPDYTDTTRGRRPDERSALLPCMQR